MKPKIAKGEIILFTGEKAPVTFNTGNSWVEIGEQAGGFWKTVATLLTESEVNQILEIVGARVGQDKLWRIAKAAGYEPGFWRKKLKKGGKK
ncbi:MAG: hypothetical protein QW318_06375 [Candidatus Caldarchaeum sp.]